MNPDRALNWVATITIAVLAVILIGGSVWATLIKIELPQWLTTADGMIILAAFGNGAFFALARAAEPTATHLAVLAENYHALAMTGLRRTRPDGPNGHTSSGGSEA